MLRVLLTYQLLIFCVGSVPVAARMEKPAVSKLWSCSSLTAGFDKVMADSATLDEAAMERELQDLFTQSRVETETPEHASS